MRSVLRYLTAALALLCLAEITDLAWLSGVRATITTTASKVVAAGNGSTTQWSFSFVGVSTADLIVSVTNSSGVTTVLTLNTQYSVTFTPQTPNSVWSVGGFVTYPLTGSPLALGNTLTIKRQIPYTQTTPFQNQGQFLPQAVETALDLLTMQVQQLNTLFSGALVEPVTDSQPLAPLPAAAARANNALCFDSTGYIPQPCSVLPASSFLVMGTPSPGWVPIATSSTTAVWGTTFPALMTFDAGITSTHSLSGAATLGNWNNFTVTSDTQGCHFCTDINSVWDYGGATQRGGRINIFGWNIQTAPNTGVGETTVGIGVEGIGQTNSGDGGGSGTEAGTYFGGNFIGACTLFSYECSGAEIDIRTDSAYRGYYTLGVPVVNVEAHQATKLDAAFAVYSGGLQAAAGGGGPWGPGVGFHYGLAFGELGNSGLVPIDSTGTLIGGHVESLSVLPVAYGFDANLFSFSQYFLRCCNGSNLFTVDGSGNVTSANLSPATILAPNLLLSKTAPTIGACGGGTPAISANNGTAAFRVTVGSATPTCVVNLPAATTGWNCFASNVTTNATGTYTTKMVPGTGGTNSVTLGNYSDVAVNTNWATSDVLAVSCFAL